MPELPGKLGDYAGAKLSARGIEVMTETSLREATAHAVVTADGQKISTQTVVTTVGNAPTPLMRSLGLPFDRGKVETEATLAGYDGVWALGDCALVPLGDDSYAPPTAQFALREAKCVARNIAAVLKGQAPGPFDHSTKGAMASLGHYQGVAEVFGVRISGLVAWLLWRSFYISMLPGFFTRLRVALNWAFDYVLPRNLVQLDTREERGSYFEVVDNYFKRIPDKIYPPGIRARRADGE